MTFEEILHHSKTESQIHIEDQVFKIDAIEHIRIQSGERLAWMWLSDGEWLIVDHDGDELILCRPVEEDDIFDRLYKKKQKIRREDIPAATELFTPNWIVTWLVQNSLGRYWMQMHPDSRLADKLEYLVPLAGEMPDIPLKKVKEIKFLDPACGTMHFGLVAFDLIKY